MYILENILYMYIHADIHVKLWISKTNFVVVDSFQWLHYVNDCIILTWNIVECSYQTFIPIDILDNPFIVVEQSNYLFESKMGQVPFKASTELLYKSLIYLVYDYIKSNEDGHYILRFHSWCWCALHVIA